MTDDEIQSRANGLAAFAMTKVSSIADCSYDSVIPAFWSALADMIHERSSGALGEKVSKLREELKASRKFSGSKSVECSELRLKADRYLREAEDNVRILRAALVKAYSCLEAVRDNRPYRYCLDEIVTVSKLAMRNTAPPWSSTGFPYAEERDQELAS